MRGPRGAGSAHGRGAAGWRGRAAATHLFFAASLEKPHRPCARNHTTRALFRAPAGRIIHADNSAFFPSFFVTFENIRFTGGAAAGLGGAFFNNGKLQVRRQADRRCGLQWSSLGRWDWGAACRATCCLVVSSSSQRHWFPLLSAQAEFKNCEFVENSAQGGAGAVSLQDGAIGLFSKSLFRSNSAGVGGRGVWQREAQDAAHASF